MVKGIFEIKPKLEHSDENNKFFWATIGGMGLTGIIQDNFFNKNRNPLKLIHSL